MVCSIAADQSASSTGYPRSRPALVVSTFGVALAVGIHALPARAQCGAPYFNTATAYFAGQSPLSVATGDFNRDGIPDLAVANVNDGDVSIFLGLGNGTFSSPNSFFVGGPPFSVVVGDFNKDGKQDLAVAQLFAGATILLGNGDGTFNFLGTVATGGLSGFVASGDFNHDGNTDLALPYQAPSAGVSVLLGDGMGGFPNLVNVPIAGLTAGTLTTADIDKDGNLDLVVPDEGAGVVWLVRGHGDMTFDAPVPLTEPSPIFTAVADFNRDGKLDLATVLRDGSNSISIRLGNGNGTFQASMTFPVGAVMPASLVVGDFTRDGLLDLAVTNADGYVTLLPGNGDGTFQPALPYLVGLAAGPSGIVAGDFNRDGALDVATANSQDNTVAVLLGRTCLQGPYTFDPKTDFPAGGTPFSIAIGDLNCDGKPDLAVASAGAVWVLAGDGMGMFNMASLFPAGSAPRSVAIGDVNRDGKPDLVVANVTDDNVTVLLGDGMGLFNPAMGSPFPAGDGPFSVAIGDLNGDGKPDLAVANQNSNNVSVLLGDGMGGFTGAPGSPFAVGIGPRSVAIGDVNRDGKPDLVVANLNSNNVSVLLGDGMGGFAGAPGSPFAAGIGPRSVAIGDLNGDGKPDLAVANVFSNNVSVLLGDGTGTFSAAMGSPIAAGLNPVSVAIGDLDGDGKPDLAVANVSGNNISVFLGDGMGMFSLALGSPYAAGVNPVSVGIGDLNGDGKVDLAVANEGSSNVSVLLGDRIGIGACCLRGGLCFTGTRDDCAGPGGEYQGDATVCDAHPCVGACCNPSTGVCTTTSLVGCPPATGVFQPGKACDSVPCGSGIDCNGNKISDEFECCWMQGTIAMDPNGQASHVGGSVQGGNRVADDFYVNPGEILRVYGFTGHIITDSQPNIRKARLDFYDDCGGAPAQTPFATYLNPTILDTKPSTSRPGFDIVNYFFDFCSNSLWLDGRKSYWVSLVELTDGQGSDESYWATVPATLPMIGSVPYKASGTSPGPVITFENTSWGPWGTITDCCIGCVNMDFSLRCEACDCIWDNGAPRTDIVSGDPSGVNLTKESRAADNFVIPQCETRELCLLEGWVWTNCLNPVFFIELYDNDCATPGDLLHLGYSVVGTYSGISKVSGGKTFKLYKVSANFPTPIALPPGMYWISVGATQVGSFNALSLFAPRVDDCSNPGCSVKISPAQDRQTRPTLDPAWTVTSPPHDLAFRVGLKPLDSSSPMLMAQGSGGVGGAALRASPCRTDMNGDGRSTAQDLFDFLNIFFAGCP